jgi:hypothetical protein
MDPKLDKAIDRQREIWASMYGQAEAAELEDDLRAVLANHPERNFADAVEEVDPVDEDSYGGLSATRI